MARMAGCHDSHGSHGSLARTLSKLDFDNWVTKVNSGIGLEVMQEGR